MANKVPIRILLDSGTSSTILLRPFVNKLSKHLGPPIKWKTMGGSFITQRKALIELTLPEFSTSKTIPVKVHVDDRTNPVEAQYDMIIGTDLMEKLKIDLTFSKQIITWDNVSIPMKERGTITNRDNTQTLYEVQQNHLFYA